MKREYKVINLNDMISMLGEDKSKEILSSFYCPKNKDVQDFIRVKAIEFSKQGLARTHLIFMNIKNEMKLLGYFTLSNKAISIHKKSLSNKLRSRISKFGNYENEYNAYTLSAILIGQIGKNYANEVNKFIKGEEILKIACDKVKNAQLDIGGRVVYLECEDVEYLVDFYTNNGFHSFGKRMLDKDEKDSLSGKYLIQFLRYL
ncbi:N-acetyltransferase [Romboutsia sp. MSSM.1001216sp_RTP31141st1_G3_RTP31141_220114]|uniref:N-acetyltransferase n=1 Tax=unclassified Romboutsia TaxID=2626894 RepID=UPI0031B5688B